MTNGSCFRYRRSADIVLWWDSDRLHLISAGTGAEYAVDFTVARLLHELNSPMTEAELAERGVINGEHLSAVLGRLTAAGIVQTTDGTQSEPLRPSLTLIEMATHAQAARGPLTVDSSVPAPSARLQFSDAPVHALPSGEEGTELSKILSKRRSVREYAARPLATAELGAFLWEVGRVRGWIGHPGGHTTHRASPSAGARHSLELFLLVRDADELTAGVYHYDPFDHCLTSVGSWTTDVQSLQERTVCVPARLSHPPPVSIYLVSYVERVTWKYHGMALSAIYRDAGCLMQTMYLVATELNLEDY